MWPSTFDINENVAVLVFGLHVKNAQTCFFVIAWRHRTQPRQAKLGLASDWGQEAPFIFLSKLERRGIKTRQHKGPTAGGVLKYIYLHHPPS